ncbi:aryl-alcohol dehydrogenase-like predicted oxidoreductase [Rhizobium sp. BK313]|nr:aryl-alcohol dehydrogenase-like predicted oxidoreductase [Rhizobium sp. BK313]
MLGDRRPVLCRRRTAWPGEVGDDESIRAVERAVDLGIRFFDTASNYGAGHFEEVVGRAIEAISSSPLACLGSLVALGYRQAAIRCVG